MLILASTAASTIWQWVLVSILLLWAAWHVGARVYRLLASAAPVGGCHGCSGAAGASGPRVKQLVSLDPGDSDD